LVGDEQRMRIARGLFKDQTFSRKQYLQLLKTISPVTASRDLKWGVDAGTLARTGDHRMAVYAFAKPKTASKKRFRRTRQALLQVCLELR